MEEKKLNVGRLMTRDVVTLDVNMSILDAIEKMTKYSIGSLIITEVGDPVGILTERDIIKCFHNNNVPPNSIPVRKAMNFPLITISQNDEVSDAVRRMNSNSVRRLVVVEDRKLIGIITERDILRTLPHVYLQLAEYEKKSQK